MIDRYAVARERRLVGAQREQHEPQLAVLALVRDNARRAREPQQTAGDAPLACRVLDGAQRAQVAHARARRRERLRARWGAGPVIIVRGGGAEGSLDRELLVDGGESLGERAVADSRGLDEALELRAVGANLDRWARRRAATCRWTAPPSLRNVLALPSSYVTCS